MEAVEPEDLDERLDVLRENLTAGLASAEDQAGDVDASDPAAVRQSKNSVAALRAVVDVVNVARA